MPEVRRPPVTPTCRYGHGNLKRATGAGLAKEWGLSADSTPGAFLLALFICPNCGYSELFDLEPEVTAKQESWSKT